MNTSQVSTSQKVRDIVNHPKNKATLDQIVVKMGKLLAKKQSLIDQKPILVYEDRIWLGNYLFANQTQFLTTNNITTVISCLQLGLSQALPEVEYKQFGLKDDKDERFKGLVMDFCKTVERTKGNIYVHCFAGKSRSCAFMIGLMMKRQKISFQQASEKLKKVYSQMNPHTYFAQSLKSMETQLLHQSSYQSEDLLQHDSPKSKKIDRIDKSVLDEVIQITHQAMKQYDDLLDIQVPQSSPTAQKYEENLVDIQSRRGEQPFQQSQKEKAQISQVTQTQLPTQKEVQVSLKDANLLQIQEPEEDKVEEKTIIQTVENEKVEVVNKIEEIHIQSTTGIEEGIFAPSTDQTLLEDKESKKIQQASPAEGIIQNKPEDLPLEEKLVEKRSFLLQFQSQKSQVDHHPPPLQKQQQLTSNTDFSQKKKKNRKKKK